MTISENCTNNTSKEKNDLIDISHVCLLSGTNEKPGGVEQMRALVDTACPQTVSSIEWLRECIARMPSKVKSLLQLEASERKFMFGGGEVRKSQGKLKVPCHLELKGLNQPSDLIIIETEIVDARIPMLIGGATLEKAKAVMDIGNLQLFLPGVFGENASSIPMKKEMSGHYSIQIAPVCEDDLKLEASEESDHAAEATVLHVADLNEGDALTKEQVVKIHHYFGHAHSSKVRKLIKNAGKWNQEVEGFICDLDKCEICAIHRPKQPRPNVAIPRATKFNEILTLDLKENTKYNNAPPFIFYAICMFTKFRMGVFINDKKASKWGFKF